MSEDIRSYRDANAKGYLVPEKASKAHGLCAWLISTARL